MFKNSIRFGFVALLVTAGASVASADCVKNARNNVICANDFVLSRYGKLKVVDVDAGAKMVETANSYGVTEWMQARDLAAVILRKDEIIKGTSVINRKTEGTGIVSLVFDNDVAEVLYWNSPGAFYTDIQDLAVEVLEHDGLAAGDIVITRTQVPGRVTRLFKNGMIEMLSLDLKIYRVALRKYLSRAVLEKDGFQAGDEIFNHSDEGTIYTGRIRHVFENGKAFVALNMTNSNGHKYVASFVVPVQSLRHRAN